MSRLAKLLTSVITALCLLGVATVVYIQTQSEDDNDTVTAYFEKGIGLFKNSDVTILGVPVGKISDVEPVGQRVRVDMVIDSKYPIPADSQAEIVPISVISDRYVEFDVYEGGPRLQDGAVLDVDRTVIPAELDDVFLQLKKLLDALAPRQEGELGSLGELIVALDSALEGREQDLRGALQNGARLTQTLARAGDDISGLLANLDALFAKLGPRAGAIAELNGNFAAVMKYLAGNREDLTNTLAKLGEMTGELGDFVADNGATTASMLRRAAKITPIVLRNERSIRQSLAWLSIVGSGLRNAYHGGEIKAVDVRSNANSARLCEDFDDLPLDPEDFPKGPLRDLIQDILDELEEQICPSAGGGGGPPSPTAPISGPGDTTAPPGPDLIPNLQLDCKEQIKKVRRQIRRINEIGIPTDLKTEILDPLEDKLKLIAKKCKQVNEALEDPEALEKLLGGLPDELLEQLDLPVLDGSDDDGDELTGSAAGSTIAPVPSRSFSDRVDAWAKGLLGFLGVSS